MLGKLISNQLSHPSGVFSYCLSLVWNRRNVSLNETAFNLLSLKPSDRVLEIGFGGGYLLNRIAGVVTDGLLCGIDRSPAMVAKAEKRYRKEIGAGKFDLRCASAEKLPFPPEYFTKVCSVNSIFYWQDIRAGLREIYRVLISDGQVVLCFTSKTSLENKGFARGIHLIESETLDQMMTAIGFQNTRTSFHSDKYRQYLCMTAQKPT
jgi:ubiquinone/menaquinone biosynthesis C-methylase UbiE